jgi:hypothetical protein
VNVETGARHCWGCGAKDGAYDAALARGLDSRYAFELKIAYGLATRGSGSGRPTPRSTPPRRHDQPPACDAAPAGRALLAVDEQQLAQAQERLARLVWTPRVVTR